MAYIKVVFIFFLSNILSPQTSGQAGTQVLYLTKKNGDTIKISAQFLESNTDTVLIKVYQLKNRKLTPIQQFRSLSSFPLEIKRTSFDNKNGISITYDPAVRWGNSYLYLFDEGNNSLREIKGFRELGSISAVKSKNRSLHYSYISCGCADNCWVSKLFEIKQFKLHIIAQLRCDCSKLTASHNKVSIPNSCKDFNDDQKFERIAKHWAEALRNGL